MSVRTSIKHLQCHQSPILKALTRSLSWSLSTPPPSPKQPPSQLDQQDPYLGPVFEARFSPKSHAFRPGRNAHTVIRTIRSNFARYLWFLKGDISEIFDNVDRNCVMGCLEQVVRGRKILGLIQSAVGAMNRKRSDGDEEWPKNRKKKKAAKKKKTILNDKEPKPDRIG